MANGSRPSPSRSQLPRLAGLLTGALAMWTVLTTVGAVILANCDLPYADDWDTWTTWLQRGYSFAWFFALHNDHRIATTRLIFAIDQLAFHGRVWVPQAVSLAAQAGLAMLLWRLGKRAMAADSRESRVFAAAVAGCLFSAQQSINFIWGFQVQFFLVYAAGAAALAALLRASETADRARRGGWMALCLALAAASSFSMANGVLIWPVLFLAALWLRMGRPALSLLAAAGATVCGLYLRGWHTSPLDAPAPWWRVLRFAMAHAGTPIVPLARAWGGGAAGSEVAATLAGGLLLAYAAVHCIRVWMRRPLYSGAQAVLAHFAIFVAAASLAIAAGRAHLPLVDAFRARYITPPCILWVCLLAIAWPRLRRLAPRAAPWAVAAALLLGIAQFQLAKLRDARELGIELTRASVALAVEVNDPAVWPFLLRPVTDSAPAVKYLKAHRLAMFHDEWTQWPGQPLAPRFSIAAGPPAYVGGILEAAPVDDASRPGWRVSGWVASKSGSGPSLIVLADAGGGIAGVALAAAGEWNGYARRGAPSLTAYAVGPDGKTLYLLGTSGLNKKGTDHMDPSRDE